MAEYKSYWYTSDGFEKLNLIIYFYNNFNLYRDIFS